VGDWKLILKEAHIEMKGRNLKERQKRRLLSDRRGVLQEEPVRVEEETRRKNKEVGEEEEAIYKFRLGSSCAENVKSQTPGPNLKQRLLLINSVTLPRFRKYTRLQFILNCSICPVYVDSASVVHVNAVSLVNPCTEIHLSRASHLANN
jgi:vacuolar-type H+-ATPase subunit D/Vma8